MFELKADHVTLLARAIIEWDDSETGAPAINSKRPYGNSGVAADIAEILDLPMQECPYCGGELANAEAHREFLLQLHSETDTALEIILRLRTFKPGMYRKLGPRKWERVYEGEAHGFAMSKGMV